MKALSLTQPWANALFLGLKTWETRSWQTSYRGLLLIHAAKSFPSYAKTFAETERMAGRGETPMALGAIIGAVELVNIIPTVEASSLSAIERLYGDFAPGRFAWRLANPKRFDKPYPWKGALGLFEVTSLAIQKILEGQ